MSTPTTIRVLSVITIIGLFGCDGAKDRSGIDFSDEFDEIDNEVERMAREDARREALRKKRLEEEERLQRDEKRAEEEKRRRQKGEEQKRRAALCAELLADLRAHPKVTPSASVREFLRDDYSVELRDGPEPLDVEKFEKAIAAKNWLVALSILQGERVTEYPDEATLDGIRRGFLNHRFLVLVTTKNDLSRTHRIVLNEGKPDVGDSVDFGGKYMYVNGKPVRCNPSLYWAPRSSFCESGWERHPDGTGWYFTWHPADGEIIIIPGLNDKSLPYDQEYSAIDPDLKRCGPILLDEANAVSTGLIPTLRKKLALGEMTPNQISEALDKACLERFLARRKAALAR